MNKFATLAACSFGLVLLAWADVHVHSRNSFTPALDPSVAHLVSASEGSELDRRSGLDAQLREIQGEVAQITTDQARLEHLQRFANLLLASHEAETRWLADCKARLVAEHQIDPRAKVLWNPRAYSYRDRSQPGGLVFIGALTIAPVSS
jgi:hypothetical protein